MFEYAKIKAELEQIKCPVHSKRPPLYLPMEE